MASFGRRKYVVTGATFALAVAGTLSAQGAFAATGGGPNWTMGGQNAQNTRFNDAETTLGVGNVAGLKATWFVATAKDVSATPAVDDTTVYFPDFSGALYAVNRTTGAVKWKTNIADYTGIPGDHARATPAISGNLLIIGDQAGKAFSPDGYLLGVNKNTGALAWKTKVAGGYPILTQSPTVKGGVAYVGVASYEEALVAFGIPGFQLSFRGRMMAVDANTGAIKWITYTVPEGYTGGSVWGSSPAIDSARNQLYISTGNNYSVPDSVTACIAAATTDAGKRDCVAVDDYFDSILALDLTTGAIKWGFKALPNDAWNLACGIPGLIPPAASGCPEGEGPDYDFGQGPALFTAKVAGKPTDLVGAGQKSGAYWALNPETGARVWDTPDAGTGGIAGGLQWGSATDGQRVYTANSNSQYKPWHLQNGETVYWGGWSALDAATGAILWQTPNPYFSSGMGPVSGANGVIYACSMDDAGHMLAMNAATGAILWDFASGANCLGGAAISNGQVFWGFGYDAFAAAPSNVQGLYAFGL